MEGLPLPPKEHGNCPSCGASLDGDGIWDYFYQKALTTDGLSVVEAEAEADRVAEMYGASRTKGRWGLAIGIVMNDRVRAYHCGECLCYWDALTGVLMENPDPQVMP